MPEFNSWNQFRRFSHFVMRTSRHVLNNENQQFLATVVETSEKRTLAFPKEEAFWRAQLGHEWGVHKIVDGDGKEVESVEEEIAYPPERMTPLPDRAYDGRVNPKGIPCLYLSTDRDTAMAETRPWIGSHVSVAQFVTLRELTVVNCTADSASGGLIMLGDEQPEPEKRQQIVWGQINRAFSEPVVRTDDVAAYAPTQILAEAFRNAGFDGVAYGSKLGSGLTVALFDTTAAELATCELHVVEGVRLNFRMKANPYIVKKYYDIEMAKSRNDSLDIGDRSTQS